MMKQPKKLTRNQKQMVRDSKLVPNQWMMVEEKETILVLQNKSDGTIKTVSKIKKSV